jgi:carbon-monoxide dehydrogenase large subunit
MAMTQEAATRTLVGASVRRREDYEPLAGRAAYTGDATPPGTVYAAIYRSPHAHARILRVDLGRALQLPGVVFALAGADLPDFAKPLSPFPFQNADPFRVGNPTIRFHRHHCLARDRVRFAGEPVAAVVAEDRYVAEDALELIDAEFEPLPVVLDEERALEPGAPLLYEEWGDNAMLRFRVSGGDVERAFREADVIVRERVKSHRFTGTPLEPRAVVASYDPSQRCLELRDSTQIPHVISSVLQEELDIPGLKVRVVNGRVGGGYGQKWGHYPEETLLAVLAVLLLRPVKWVELRREHMVATNHAREQTHLVEMALKKDGTVLGLRDRILANVGAAYPVGGAATIVTTPMFVPGAYRIRNYEAELTGVVTNKTPLGAHRGFGKSEAAYVIERMMDVAAARLGLPPEEIRFRNFIRPEEMPYPYVTGSRVDSGDYPAALRRALELADVESWRRRQAEARESGSRRLIGIGMALAIEPSSSTRMGSYNAGYYSVHMRLDPSGRVYVFPSGSDEGQGHGTAIAQLVSQELGVGLDDVYTLEGDSLRCPYGSGSYSSRFSIVGASAVTLAARRLREKALEIAAHVTGVPAGRLKVGEGRVEGPGAALTLREIARIAYLRVHDLPPGMEPGLDTTYHYRDPNIAFQADERGRVAMFSSFPYAADVAVLAVDRETGLFTIERYVSVHDCGNQINPREVLGQHIGALAHGFGGALLEELRYDEHGNPLNATFMDYLVPTAVEIPPLTLDHLMSPNPFTPGGFKGAGETGTISVPPALANALEDALRPLGAEVRSTPITPEYAWRLMRAAGQEVTAP